MGGLEKLCEHEPTFIRYRLTVNTYMEITTPVILPVLFFLRPSRLTRLRQTARRPRNICAQTLERDLQATLNLSAPVALCAARQASVMERIWTLLLSQQNPWRHLPLHRQKVH